MTEMLVAILVACTAGLSVHKWGFARCAMAVLLVSVCVFPRNITSELTLRHIGIAAAAPRMTTYILAVGLLAICVLFRPRPSAALGASWIGFIIFLAVGASYTWSGGSAQDAGIIQLLLAPFAWAIGVNLAQDFDNAKYRFLVRAVAFIVFLQLAICFLQLLGVQMFAMEATQEAILGSRTNGTLGHPNDLGKVMFLLLAILLPCGRGLSRLDANLWKSGIACIFIILAMTGGRAVSAAALCALILWILLSPGTTHKKGRKVVAVGVALSVSAFLAGALLARFDEDPQGGARSTLSDVAWAQILSDPWRGVGPNSYVSAVGSYDALTASGVPVHNAFLLALAELGIAGTFLLMLPFLVGAIVALQRFRHAGQGGEASRVYLASLPGLYLITTTGWGILGGYVLPLLGLTFGLLNGWSKVQPADEDVDFMSLAQLRGDSDRKTST